MLFDTKGYNFERNIILLNVRWYLSCKLSYRELEEMAAERVLKGDYTAIYRWVIEFTPELEKAMHLLGRYTGKSWRLDETYIKVKGQCKYLYRVVDKEGKTVDYFLTAKRDRKAAKRFICKAIDSNALPIKINSDKSGANTAGLNNIIEQDHRPIKQLYGATLGFKAFKSARTTIGGFESMRINRKR